MSAKIQLEDGEERHRQHPNTFQIPSDAMKRGVQQGDHVKVVAESERFWIKVSTVNWPKFQGTVINNLVFTKFHGFQFGDDVPFEARHIINIKTLDEQQLATTNIAGEEVAEVSVAMLEQALPRVPIAQCILDDQTQIFIGSLTDNIAVSIFLRAVSKVEGPALDAFAHAAALTAAATSLGLVETALADKLPPSDTCIFNLTLPANVAGSELLERTRESIDAVREEAKRLLSAGAQVGSGTELAGHPVLAQVTAAEPAEQTPATTQPSTLPPWVVESCPQCMHGVRMGVPIPDDEITPAIVELLCPNCRVALPFDKQRCPISHEQLKELFDYVEEQFESRQGDETLRFAGEFCDREHLPKAATLDWLRSQGGYCDIEVVMNVAPRWSE